MHFSGRLIFAASSSYLIALSAATIPLSAQSDQIYHTFERGNFGLVSDNKLKVYRFSTKNLHGHEMRKLSNFGCYKKYFMTDV